MKKTLDIEKIKEAIKTLEEAREVLDEVEKALPTKQPTHYCPRPWYPWPIYPTPTKPTWVYDGTYTTQPSDNITVTFDNATATYN